MKRDWNLDGQVGLEGWASALRLRDCLSLWNTTQDPHTTQVLRQAAAKTEAFCKRKPGDFRIGTTTVRSVGKYKCTFKTVLLVNKPTPQPVVSTEVDTDTSLCSYTAARTLAFLSGLLDNSESIYCTLWYFAVMFRCIQGLVFVLTAWSASAFIVPLAQQQQPSALLATRAIWTGRPGPSSNVPSLVSMVVSRGSQ